MNAGIPRFVSLSRQKSVLRRYFAMTRNLDTTSNDVSARKIAVLIDGDNAESSLVGEFVAETGRFGKVTVKRIYADWTSPQMKSWKDQLNSYAVRPMQKFAYTQGKGSTDTALIIDAMDLLHSRKVDGFCIVSSDSDYTGLAHRIREEGLFIMGIGRSHTPAAFVQACASFTYAEILVSSTTKNVNKRTTTKKSSPAGEVVLRNVTADTTTMTTDTAAPADVNPVKDKTPGNRDIDLDLVKRAFPIAANVDTGRVYFGTLAIELRKLDSTFDVRNFGFSNFRQFCEGALAKDYQICVEKDGCSWYLTERTTSQSNSFDILDLLKEGPLK